MKRLSVIFASILIAGVLCMVAVAARSVATHNSTLRGFQTATGESDAVAVVIDAAGDLSGMGKVIFKREGNNVTGGTWTLTVLPPNADATTSELGKLSGAITGGTLSFNDNGTLTGANSVQLTVEGGSGQHANVNGGSGAVNLSSDAESPSKLNGTLVLNF